MSVLSVKNLQEVLVGKNIGRTATVQITDPTNTTTYIADGEIVALNSTGQILTSAMTYSTSPWIQLVQRSGTNLIVSNKIYGNKLFTYTGQGADAQGTEQITHIGYNGTTGSLDVSGANDFYLTITPNQDDMQWSEQKQKNVTLMTKADVGTSQLILASGIVKNVMKKYMIDGIPVTAVMLNNGVGAVFTGAATVAVTHGSNVIVPNAAITNVGFGAGSLIRIGVPLSGVGVTIPAYTVKEAHPTIPNAWILDQPYAGPSNSALLVANAGYVATPGASYGVRFTGKALPFQLDFFKFKRVNFTVQMQGFGATPLFKTQNTTYGQGDGRLCAEEESFCKGFQGALNRMTVPLPAITIDSNYNSAATTTNTAGIVGNTIGDAFVEATVKYETVQISFYGENLHTTTPSVKMPETIKLFLVPAAAQNKAATNGILTALDAWMITTPNAFAAIAGSFS
jgi:hypothetical protein